MDADVLLLLLVFRIVESWVHGDEEADGRGELVYILAGRTLGLGEGMAHALAFDFAFGLR